MKAIISKEGTLSVERHGSMRKQYCPHNMDSRSSVMCGDWCPLFNESELDRGYLYLCVGSPIIGEIEDKR